MQVAMLPDWRTGNPYQDLLARALEADGVAVRFPAGYRRGLPFCRALLPGQRPDVLHLHWPTPYLRSTRPFMRTLYCLRTLCDLWLLKRAGIRLVWTVHNLVTHDTPTPALERRFSTGLARLADRLIVHGPAARDAVIAELGASAEKIDIIPHGPLRDAYGPAPDRATARAALDLPAQAPVVLFFGLIRPYKGVPDLLAAWAALSDADRQDGTLLIVGNALDPDYAEEIRAQAARTPQTRLDMRFVPDAEIPLLMAAADLLVLPFRASLTSGTVRLAGDYGVPVVVPRTSGTSEVSNAVMAEDTGSEHLGEAIACALQQGVRQSVHTPPLLWSQIAQCHHTAFKATIRKKTIPCSTNP